MRGRASPNRAANRRAPHPDPLPADAGRGAPLGEPARRVRIVRRQIDRRRRRGERLNGGERRRRLPLVVADAVDRSGEHRRLAVGRVAGDEDGLVSILDDDREMVGRMAGRRHGDDRAVGGQTLRARERPVRAGVEDERFRIEMLGPALRQVAAHPAGDSGRPRKLAGLTRISLFGNAASPPS